MQARSRTTVIAWKAVALAVAYFAGAQLGNALSIQHAFATFWPPSGIFVAALLLCEPEEWPVLIAAGMVGNLASDLVAGRALLVTMGFTAGNALEAWTGAYLVRRFARPRLDLSTTREVTIFVAMAALMATGLSATVGALVVQAAYGVPMSATWLSWWSADVVGVIVVGSFVLTGAGVIRRMQPVPGTWDTKAVPGLAGAAAISVVSAWLSWNILGLGGASSPWKFALVPGLIAGGVVAGPFGTALVLLVTSIAGLMGLVMGAATPLVAPVSAMTVAIEVQVFLGVTGVASLWVTALLFESKQRATEAAENVSAMAAVFDGMLEGYAYCRLLRDSDGQPVDWIFEATNEAFHQLTGLENVDGKRGSHAMAGALVSSADLLELFADVASTGISTTIDVDMLPSGRSLHFAVTRPAADRFVLVVEDVTERIEAERARSKRLEMMALTDQLTGLRNRRGFDLLSEQALVQAKRDRRGVGLLFVDVDGLKSVNDHLGHGEGDDLLRDVATIMSFALRSADVVARFGGDEFVVLAAVSSEREMVAMRDRLLKAVTDFNATHDRPYDLSLSCGFAWVPEPSDIAVEQLVRLADTAMYADRLERRQGRP